MTTKPHEFRRLNIAELKLTLVHIPGQMPQTVPRVERERCGKNCLASVLDNVRQARDQFDDVGGRKGLGGDKVSEEVSVHHCTGVIVSVSFGADRVYVAHRH